MAAFRNQIVGLVRFSYPSLSGFTKKPADIAGLIAELYTPARLDARFHLFEKLALPSLLAQTDQDFQTILMVGDRFPKAARDRLQALIDPLSGARIVALPPLHHYPAMQRAYSMVADPQSSHLTSFRLDDDDALDRHHVARLRDMAAGVMRIVGKDVPYVIGSNRGFFLELSPSGNTVFDVVEKLPLGIGLAMTAPLAGGENIFSRNHRLLSQFYTTFTEVETPAFIRTVHAGNDSNAHTTGQVRTMGPSEVKAVIEERFPFTLQQLMSL